jgi:hypothetical protein
VKLFCCAGIVSPPEDGVKELRDWLYIVEGGQPKLELFILVQMGEGQIFRCPLSFGRWRTSCSIFQPDSQETLSGIRAP